MTQDNRLSPKELNKKSSWFQFSLRQLLLAHVIVAIVLSCLYYWPKQEALLYDPSAYVGYYRGLGLKSSRGFFGKNFYHVHVSDGEYGYWEVEVEGIGFNSYRGYYRNGKLREKGYCYVEHRPDLHENQPVPDNNLVRDAKYYGPDGKLASEVVDSSGIQTYFYLNGQPRWELTLSNGERTRVSMWHENGQLKYQMGYLHGKPHGKFERYFANGNMRMSGEYRLDEPAGEWKYWNEDGQLKYSVLQGL